MARQVFQKNALASVLTLPLVSCSALFGGQRDIVSSTPHTEVEPVPEKNIVIHTNRPVKVVKPAEANGTLVIDVDPANNITVYTSQLVDVMPPSTMNTLTASTVELMPGTKMSDGTIYAGISPVTNKPLYTMPHDVLGREGFPLGLNFNAAAHHVDKLKAYGHEDWRVPSEAELALLCANKDKGALKGTFDLSNSATSAWYWSSTPNFKEEGRTQRLRDCYQSTHFKTYVSSVRPVR